MNRNFLPIAIASLASLAAAGCAADATTPAAEQTGTTTAAVSTGLPGCPGSDWTIPDTWKGLAGSYLRPWQLVTPPDEISFLDVYADPPRDAVPWTTYLRLSGNAVQSGKLLAEPSNPAIGPTFLFEDASGNVIDVYFPEWITRDPTTGHVTKICLEKSSNDRTHTFYTLARVGL